MCGAACGEFTRKKGRKMYNILVCDDEKDIVSALEIYLTADGYQVFTAYNGRQAVDILNKEEIHLVLMDIMMPEMNGISAMVKIREKKQRAGHPSDGEE